MAKNKKAPIPRTLLIERNRSNAILALIAGALLAIVGVMLLVILLGGPDRDVPSLALGVIGIVGGIALVVWAARLLAMGTLVLAVDERGLTDRTTLQAPGLVPWSQVTSVYESEEPGGQFICVDLQDPEAFADQLPARAAQQVRSNVLAGLAPVRVPMGPLAKACSSKHVLACVRRQRPAVCRGRRKAKS